jgi:hypothetical protein
MFPKKGRHTGALFYLLLRVVNANLTSDKAAIDILLTKQKNRCEQKGLFFIKANKTKN